MILTKTIHLVHQEHINELHNELEKTSKELSTVQVKQTLTTVHHVVFAGLNMTWQFSFSDDRTDS